MGGGLIPDLRETPDQICTDSDSAVMAPRWMRVACPMACATHLTQKGIFKFLK